MGQRLQGAEAWTGPYPGDGAPPVVGFAAGQGRV